MFVRGYENFGAQIEENKVQGMKSRKKERLFAIKGKSIPFVFLDDPGIGLSEHQLTFAGQHNYNNFFNCLKENCPICYAGYKPSFISLYSVFDLSPWQKDGKTHGFSKRIFAAKESDIAVLVKFRQDFGGSLKGGVFTLTKGNERKDRAVISPALRNGSIVKYSDQDILQMVLKDGYKPELAQPYNYEALFANDSVAMLEAQIPRILVQNRNAAPTYAPQYEQYDHSQQYGYQPQQQQYAPQQNFQPQQGYQPPQFAAHNQPPQDQGYQPPNFAPPQDQGYQPQTQSNFNPPPQGSNFNPPQQAPQGGVQLYPNNNGNAPVSRKDHLNDIPF